MSELPNNPHMLVSAVNMLLRDDEFDSLDDLCACFDRDPKEIQAFLQQYGYEYNPEQKQFK